MCCLACVFQQYGAPTLPQQQPWRLLPGKWKAGVYCAEAGHKYPADVRACSDAGGAILDLMSSWVSHLPEEMAFSRVVGHGMNAAEAGALPGHAHRW